MRKIILLNLVFLGYFGVPALSAPIAFLPESQLRASLMSAVLKRSITIYLANYASDVPGLDVNGCPNKIYYPLVKWLEELQTQFEDIEVDVECVKDATVPADLTVRIDNGIIRSKTYFPGVFLNLKEASAPFGFADRLTIALDSKTYGDKAMHYKIFLHEFGHALTGLADLYEDYFQGGEWHSFCPDNAPPSIMCALDTDLQPYDQTAIGLAYEKACRYKKITCPRKL